MTVVNLYNNIFKTLLLDEELLDLMSLTNENLVIKTEHIQKRRKPQNLLKSLPIITFYSPSGGVSEKNNEVYEATFVFDVYTQDDVELAQKISELICKLFDGKINSFYGIENFETALVEAFESEVNLSNTYCFTTVLLFSLTIRGDKKYNKSNY